MNENEKIPNICLRKYIKENSWTPDGYTEPCPLEIVSRASGNLIKPEESRNTRMASKSPNELAFLEEWKWLNPLEEYQVYIEHPEVWKDLCRLYGNKDTDRTFFQADFFFPSAGIIVEIDSDYHIGKRDSDQARDSYMEMVYGWKTFRYEYYYSGTNTSDFFEAYKKRHGRWKEPGWDITFRETMCHKYRESLGILWLLRDEIILAKGKPILLTMKDLYEYKVIDEARDWPVSRDMKTAVELWKDWTDQEIYIHPGSCQYRRDEMIEEIKRTDPWDRWKDKVVPGWITCVHGKPPRGIRYDLSRGLSGAREFMKKLKDYDRL